MFNVQLKIFAEYRDRCMVGAELDVEWVQSGQSDLVLSAIGISAERDTLHVRTSIP